jgi:hypothetical protein
MRWSRYLHPTYAVTPDRQPLGILDAWMWARERKAKQGLRSGPKESLRSGPKESLRSGPKESLRWIEGYERIAEMAAQLPATRLVYVADRVADMVPLMLRAQELGTPADWLVRAQHNRCLPQSEKLWHHASAGTPLGEIAFEMAARHGVKARTVRQQLWARKVELPAGQGKTVSVTCLIARELDAPADVKPIEWRLLSNRDVGALAVEMID